MKPKILFVEDDIVLRNNYVEILELYNFTVIPAEDGQEAYEILQHENVDVIVSDIRMPRMNGLAFLKTIRSEAKWVNLPFILLSAHAENIDYENGIKNGANDYLTKPIRGKDLVNAIQNVLP
jgi:DNA-binding response OmpR family regulator